MPAFTRQAAGCPSVLLPVAVCLLVSARCWSLKAVSPLLLFSYIVPTTNPLQQQSYLFLFGFLVFRIFVLLDIVKCLISNTVLLFAYYFPKNSIVTSRNCRFFGPCAVRAFVLNGEV